MKPVKSTIPVYDICTLSDDTLQHEDIIASGFADYLAAHPNLHFPHRHSFYHMVLFTAGAGSHSIDFEGYAVMPGQVYCMVPGQVHTWNFDGMPDGYIINFTSRLFADIYLSPQFVEQFPFFRGIAQQSVLQLPSKVMEQAIMVIKQIIAELAENYESKAEMLCSLLTQLLVLLGRECELPGKGRLVPHNQVILQNFRSLIDQYYATNRLPSEYAAMLYITPNHLNALCRDLIGKAAGELIRDRVLLEAKRLLVNMDEPISAISWRLNFSDTSYFTKFFKKYIGVTPEAFRKANAVI